MDGKKGSESSVMMAQQMTPQDANNVGNVHGGVVMRLIDSAAGVVAIKHSRLNVVTASIDRLDFHNPSYVGDMLVLRARLNLVGRTSMEIGVRVESENIFTGEVKHTASAYLTFVALDENGKPTPLPPLLLETDEDARRNSEAAVRREARIKERQGGE